MRTVETQVGEGLSVWVNKLFATPSRWAGRVVAVNKNNVETTVDNEPEFYSSLANFYVPPSYTTAENFPSTLKLYASKDGGPEALIYETTLTKSGVTSGDAFADFEIFGAVVTDHDPQPAANYSDVPFDFAFSPVDWVQNDNGVLTLDTGIYLMSYTVQVEPLGGTPLTHCFATGNGMPNVSSIAPGINNAGINADYGGTVFTMSSTALFVLAEPMPVSVALVTNGTFSYTSANSLTIIRY